MPATYGNLISVTIVSLIFSELPKTKRNLSPSMDPSAVLPKDEDIRKEMEKLVTSVDIDNTTTKQFIKLLSKQMKVDLKPKKSFIKDTLTSIFDSMESGEENQIEDESEGKIIADQKSKKSTRKIVISNRGGGLAAIKELSPAMADFMGKLSAARTEIVKELWVYIKENDLQNPQNKKEIICDDRLKKIFGVDQVTMFTLNKYVGAHIHPFSPVNLTELSENSKKRKAENAFKKIHGNKTRITGIHVPWLLSDDLSAVVGKRVLSRPQVTQGLWVYIREHNLQVSFECCNVYRLK